MSKQTKTVVVYIPGYGCKNCSSENCNIWCICEYALIVEEEEKKEPEGKEEIIEKENKIKQKIRDKFEKPSLYVYQNRNHSKLVNSINLGLIGKENAIDLSKGFTPFTEKSGVGFTTISYYASDNEKCKDCATECKNYNKPRTVYFICKNCKNCPSKVDEHLEKVCNNYNCKEEELYRDFCICEYSPEDYNSSYHKLINNINNNYLFAWHTTQQSIVFFLTKKDAEQALEKIKKDKKKLSDKEFYDKYKDDRNSFDYAFNSKCHSTIINNMTDYYSINTKDTILKSSNTENEGSNTDNTDNKDKPSKSGNKSGTENNKDSPSADGGGVGGVILAIVVICFIVFLLYQLLKFLHYSS